jgi:hypothetical protein
VDRIHLASQQCPFTGCCEHGIESSGSKMSGNLAERLCSPQDRLEITE